MAPGVPTELQNGHQPTKTMRPASESDIEMTGVDVMMANHIQDTHIHTGKPDDMDGDLARVSTPVHHATTINDEGLEEQIPAGADENNNDVTAPWTDNPGWGFDILNSSANGHASDSSETASENAVGNPEDQPSISPDNEDNVTETANEPNTTEDAGAPGDEQAISDAIAEDVAAEAAAADQASTQDWLAAQDRWLNQLANDNPEDFARLVESGVIDEDFIPQRLVQDDGNNMNDANANTDDAGNHAATNVDGQVDDAIEEEEVDSGDGNNAGTNPVAPAQPAPDGNNNTAPGNPAPDTDHFIWLANRNDAREENTVCPACQTDFAPTDDIIYLDCGHAWCSECLNANYRSALKNRAQWPPRCCNIAIAHHSIAYLLEDELQMELAMKMDEFADRNPIFCQTPKCIGGYIASERRDGQWASCQVCRLSTCVECKAPATAHPMPSMHPNMIAQLDKELADGQGWKQCPGCRNVVERLEGCNFMSCECGHHFCYQCGKTLENNMPCDCMGQQQWVADMNNEAAGIHGGDDGGADDENEDESESEGEDGSESESESEGDGEGDADQGDSESSSDDEDSDVSDDSEDEA